MPALLHEPSASDLNLFCADHPLPSASPSLADAVAYALRQCPGFQFLPSNYDGLDDAAVPFRNGSSPSAHFSCDDFRMYEFKVRRCMRGRSHDWTECPFAHPGEKARRRDPRRIHYSGSPCPDFRKGSCRRGDACEFAHGVFECWLHPARYRTQECKDGRNCKRRVCFFAHCPEQLRILPESSTSTTQAEKGYGCIGGGFVDALSFNKGFSANVSSPNSSVGMQKTRQISPSLVIPVSPLTPHSPVQVSPLALHQDLTNLSGFSRAAIQNALACKAYGVNLNAAEYSPLPDGYENLPEVHARCVPHINMQQVHFRNCLDESLFTKFSLPSESSYEFPSYTHGFTSPTSTLAGHVFSPPPLSPPLSPLTTSNTSGIRQLISNSANDCNGFFVTNADEAFVYQNESYVEDLGFHLQNLCIASGNDISHADQNPCGAVQAGQSVTSAQQLRLPPVKNSASDPLCRYKQALWGHASKFACSDGSAYDLWQAGEFAAQELGMSKNGEESISDNFAPDFGWVSELVK